MNIEDYKIEPKLLLFKAGFELVEKNLCAIVILNFYKKGS
jgi:hypothetical protein